MKVFVSSIPNIDREACTHHDIMTFFCIAACHTKANQDNQAVLLHCKVLIQCI